MHRAMLLSLATGTTGLLPLGAALLAVAGVLRWRQRRRADAPTPVHTVRLTAQHALHVVELHGRRFVIGTAPGAAPRLVESRPVSAADPAEPPWIQP